MAKTSKKSRRPAKKRGTKRPAKKKRPASPRPRSGPFGSLLSTLARTYGRRRRPAGDTALDGVVLAVLAGDRGERGAARIVSRFKSHFVDWNEARVARPRDLAAAAPDVPEARVKRTQVLLQALYENLGGLSPEPLLEMKSAEARRWLTSLGGLSREEVDAVLMIALGMAVMPASDSLARVLRRLGMVPRKASRARAQRAAVKGLESTDYREFYSLVGGHAAGVCREEAPDCKRCKLRRICKSKGRW